MLMLAALFAAVGVVSQSTPPVPPEVAAALSARLRRAGDLAQVFRREAPNYTGVETLRQRAIMARHRFGRREPEVTIQTREIVSEYGYSTMSDAPEALREFRKVVTVDGKAVTAHVKARETLMQGITSRDDRLKRQMLRDFAGYGLEGVISDFGQVVALFNASRLERFVYQPLGSARLGPDAVTRLAFREKEGSGLTVFEDKQVVHQPLQGEIWLRDSDSAPVRIVVVSSRKLDVRDTMRDETAIDYTLNAAGVLLPAAVVHRQWVNGQLSLEDILDYSDFKKFSADAVIKFTVDPQPR
jgi:hypothetical protein